jgi:hypothetical protein
MEVNYHPLFEHWLTGGDKTALGNNWYPANIAESQARLENYTRQHTDLNPIVKRGNR